MQGTELNFRVPSAKKALPEHPFTEIIRVTAGRALLQRRAYFLQWRLEMRLKKNEGGVQQVIHKCLPLKVKN